MYIYIYVYNIVYSCKFSMPMGGVELSLPTPVLAILQEAPLTPFELTIYCPTF